MANADRPFGLRPVMHLDGSPWNGKVSTYLVPSTDGTAIYVGDPVKSGGTGGAAGTIVYGQNCEGMATVAVAAAGDTLRGVVIGFSPLQSNLETLHRAASTARLAYVVDSPDVVFEVQSDEGGAALALIDIGENADILYTAGSAVTGRSAVELDSSSHVTATAQLRILGFVQRVDNEAGANYGKVHVVINEHEFKATAGL
jgi:hypothetical protein